MSNVVDAKKMVIALMAAVAKPGGVKGTTVKTIRYNEHCDVVYGNIAWFVKNTWLNVPAYSWEVRERGAHGRRTTYHWWIEKAVGQDTEWEAGTLTARTVTGNPYGSTYEVLAESHIVTIEGLSLS